VKIFAFPWMICLPLVSFAQVTISGHIGAKEMVLAAYGDPLLSGLLDKLMLAEAGM
jgi:hypothetical protein